MSESEKNQPVKEVKIGSIKCAIWRNETKNGPMFATSPLSRVFKKGEDWANSGSLRRDDLPIAIVVLTRAFVEILSLEEELKHSSQTRAADSAS